MVTALKIIRLLLPYTDRQWPEHTPTNFKGEKTDAHMLPMTDLGNLPNARENISIGNLFQEEPIS